MRVSASELVTAYDSTHSDSKIPGNEGNAYFVHFYQLWDRIEEVIDRVKVQYALRDTCPNPSPSSADLSAHWGTSARPKELLFVLLLFSLAHCRRPDWTTWTTCAIL